MKNIVRAEAEMFLRSFVGQSVYLHSEATSYLFVRNFRVALTEAHLAGDGPFRAALRFDEIGWLRIEGLTDFELDGQGRLFFAGHDDRGRMYATLELSREPFPE